MRSSRVDTDGVRVRGAGRHSLPCSDLVQPRRQGRRKEEAGQRNRQFPKGIQPVPSLRRRSVRCRNLRHAPVSLKQI